jgi:hypothetical protein
MASPTSRHLARLWRSVPLKGLQQGSTLSIRSNLSEPMHLLLKPEWRDNGHAELKQVFSKNSSVAEAQMNIKQEGDQMTSLGRMASHVSLLLEPLSPTTDETHNDAAKDLDLDQPGIPYSKPTLPDKVILDNGTIFPDSDEFSPPPEGKRRVEYHDGITHVTSDGQVEEPGIFLTVQMPEKVNLVCELHHGGSITIAGKVEGDIRLYTADGDLSVAKLRGHTVDLESQGTNNVIFVKDLVEAQNVSVQTRGRLRAKQIQGTSVDIQINPNDEANLAMHSAMDEDDEGSLVDIGSMYIGGDGGATIKVGSCQPSRRAVRVKSNHGPLRVETDGVGMPTETNQATERTYPVVELGGVNGNCEVSIGNVGSLENSKDIEWSSCLVHVDSLSPDSVSLVTTQQGDVSVTLDRKVEADLRLLSVPSSTGESLLELGATIAEEEDSDAVGDALRNFQDATPSSKTLQVDQQRVSIETRAFSRRRSDIALQVEGLEYVDGWVENKSAEPDSRFERKSRGGTGSVGKIRLDGAANQALYGFSSSTAEKGGDAGYLRPLFAVAGTKRIIVETVSWLGAIARRYGLEEGDRDLGRTALRRGRPFAPKDE